MILSWLIVGASASWALGESADIELVRPVYSKGSLPGIDTPLMEEFGQYRFGFWTQYVRDPLVLLADTSDRGAVIAQRQTGTLGINFDLGARAAARFSLPIAAQWGSENPALTGSNIGLGDMSIGLRANFLEAGPFSVGGRADLALPTGTRFSWLGEESARFFIGGLGFVDLAPFEILLDVGGVFRDAVDTERDFVLANELTANLGARYWLWPERVNFGAGLLSRTGLNQPFQRGAETSSELIASLQWNPTDALQWEAGVGKGLAQGYGTSEFRAFVGLTVQRVREETPLPRPEVRITETDPAPVPIDIEELIEAPEWEEGELAKREVDRIVIREPIQFEFNTANILPESIPTLRYVARLINGDWRIGHLVIEGHASEEGGYQYNYELSSERAHAVFEQLITAGVHIDRISHRGMGEVLPATDGTDEASLASNRRVEFVIVNQLRDDEEPEYRKVLKIPWDGEAAEMLTPLPEKAKEVDPSDPLDEDFFTPDEPLDGSLFDEPEPEPEPASEPSPTPQPEEDAP